MSGLHMLYLIGVPGSGKSTLAAELVRGRRRRVRTVPFAHTVYDGGLVQLGRERAAFSGTDALSMSVQPKAQAALATGVWQRVLGEGDRLANGSFFQAVRDIGYQLDVALLDVPEELAAERRAERGSDQSEQWLRGRRSKVEGLREWVTITLDGTWPVEHSAAVLADHPALMQS